MNIVDSSHKSASWPIGIGAEGIAAAQFARCGLDVLIQAGHDKPWYSLAVTRSGNLFKIAVRPSENGRWELTQAYSRRGLDITGNRIDCRRAIDLWVDSHGAKTICCLVQFEGVSIHQMPRIYLAYPWQVAEQMRLALERTGQCTLLEQYDWTAADGRTGIEALPSGWRFSPERVDELLSGHPLHQVQGSAPSRTALKESFAVAAHGI